MAKEIRITIVESPAEEGMFRIRVGWLTGPNVFREEAFVLLSKTQTRLNFNTLYILLSKGLEIEPKVEIDVYTNKGQRLKEEIMRFLSQISKHLS